MDLLPDGQLADLTRSAQTGKPPPVLSDCIRCLSACNPRLSSPAAAILFFHPLSDFARE